MSAEIALEDPSVLGAVEHGAPVLELPDAVGRLLRVELRHAPVVEHLAAQHRVLEVDLPGIARVHVRQRDAVVEDCRAATLRIRRHLAPFEHAAGGKLDQPGGDLRAADVDPNRRFKSPRQ